MGIDSTCLPDHFLEKLFPEDRKKLGRAGRTVVEAKASGDFRAEKEMHKHFYNWLMLRSIPRVHAGMHKRSTIEVGHPDFTLLWDNRNLLIEFKMPGQKLNPEQEKQIDFLRRAGNKVVVCHSFSEAIEVTKQHFNL